MPRLSNLNTSPIAVKLILAICTFAACSGVFTSCERTEPQQIISIDTTMGFSEVDTVERGFRDFLMSVPEYKKEAAIDSFFNERPNIPNLKGRYLAFKTAHFIRNRQLIRATETLDSLIVLTRDVEGAQQLHAEALFNKADVYMLMGKYAAAYEFYNKAGEISARTKNPCISSMFDYRIAMVLYRQEFYGKAVEYFKRAKSTTLTCDNAFFQHYRVQEIYDNIALCYFHMKQYDTSQLYYDSTLFYIDNIRAESPSSVNMLEVAKAVVRSNRADCFLVQGDTAKALELYESAVTPLTIEKERGFVVGSLIRLSEVYLHQNNLTKAEHYINRAEELEQHFGLTQRSQSLVRLKLKLALLKKDHDLAIVYADRYWEVRDSLLRLEKEMQANNINLSLQTFEFNEREYALLQESKSREERLLLSIIVAIAAFIANMVSLYSWMKTRSQNKELIRLNKQIEDQSKTIRQTYEDLKVLDQAKDRIMGIVAHDLRNPISAIYSMASLLREQAVERKDEEEIQMTTLVRTACESSLELIQEIMMVADLQHNKGVVKKQRVLVNEFVDATVKLIRFKSAEKKQTIQVLLSSPAEAAVMISPDQIRRVLNNLLMNAIKFSKEGSNIVVRSQMLNNRWRMEVTDQGIGIPVAIRDNIFEMFTRAKRAGTSGEKPFGLGLSIVKQIVEAHGGRIWFESEEGAGSTFFVELPAE